MRICFHSAQDICFKFINEKRSHKRINSNQLHDKFYMQEGTRSVDADDGHDKFENVDGNQTQLQSK